MDIKKFFRHTPLYKRTYRNILNFDESHLDTYFGKFKEDVEFYKKYKQDNLLDCPILRKDEVLNNENLFLSKKYLKFTLLKSSTGGTSGKSLNLYRSYKDVIREMSYVDYAFSLIGNDLNVAVLRGVRPKNGLSSFINNKLILSSYDLTADTIQEYLTSIKKYNINCLHAYPSSLLIFLRIVVELRLEKELSGIKGILTSSEIFSIEDKIFVKSVLPDCELIDLYGQNEHVAFAISVNLGKYKFYNSYGYTEFIPIERDADGNQIAEIVSTGFINDAMPFIRYGTEDYIVLDDSGMVVSILGRSQDYVYDFDRQRIPCTVLTRPKTLENVLSFQFFQEKYGVVEFHVTVNSSFGEDDIQNIILDFKNTFGERISAIVKVCPNLPRTKRGKLKRLIQNI
ncbi:phenylacetate-coenzyme A ligase PaaK-like adenylate-forming protein [Ancylomarina subtilis]|uniref:Phenylacetate-coenzyme A ligase PaaK-like adenylate-forming protein n=1 Tax=Ancylomarina subtilis TaxID=1639035 RepID=A0A4Q7VJZ8_9BACT|nr:hypothetical protein [Ancylomarina subtilis]RZT96489.1 phenylacetate-coenzyme A ligase PaaK-like adenylate-forming protein [Ancylomarina subtilis]